MECPYPGQKLAAGQAEREPDDDDEGSCTNPEGHRWNMTPGEADEQFLAGNNVGIRCIHCGADGDA
jgi:hypothetical protein